MLSKQSRDNCLILIIFLLIILVISGIFWILSQSLFDNNNQPYTINDISNKVHDKVDRPSQDKPQTNAFHVHQLEAAITEYITVTSNDDQAFDAVTVSGQLYKKIRIKNDDYYIVKTPVTNTLPAAPTNNPITDNSVRNNKIIAELTQQAEAEIAKDRYRKGHKILLVKARTGDHKTFRARAEFYLRGGYRGRPMSNNSYEFFTGLPGYTYELRIQAPGYHQFIRTIKFSESNHVTVWDDIVLEPVTQKEGATIAGRIWLEGKNPQLGGIRVSGNGESATTDSEGYFLLTGIGSGYVRISAAAEGYHGLWEELYVEKSAVIELDMKGYLQRRYKVKWAYQPNGSREFSGNQMKTGEAILQDNKLDRVSFSKGFVNVHGHSDFMIFQKKDKVVIKNFDVRRDGPAFYESTTPFDELKTIPTSAPFTTSSKNTTYLALGKTFVFRTYDGNSYAKIFVMEALH